MKFRRSERLIDMTDFLLKHPRQLVPLTVFAERYSSAKSSISEDLAIIKEVFEAERDWYLANGCRGCGWSQISKFK